ncbi:hypothetical protein Csp2054_12730 [Curtobacterium sp. 'Ferrero']|uniref:hypothetical protein n=1 Tax=Curtobacterium sp. 'Ferrero' TaxID=2033654 RepID=UPI000BD9FF89|nr:hypothetical protein [Curtobacterium sp. 'Ferrero']PCN47316.1 hypothetical protein Csp2054_12730 [Curtobacterium sp. 'Ferrero']
MSCARESHRRADEESDQARRTGQAGAHHGGSDPVASGVDVLAFGVVALDQPSDWLSDECSVPSRLL